MFTRIGNQGVKSDKGFIVQSVDRFCIEYREGDRKISVTVDRGLNPKGVACIYIQTNEFSSWDDGSLIEDRIKSKIINNFSDGMKFLGVQVISE